MPYKPTAKETAEALQLLPLVKRHARRRAPARFDPDSVTQSPLLEGWTMQKHSEENWEGRCHGKINGRKDPDSAARVKPLLLRRSMRS
jgi:hypothetical protein